MPKIVDHDQYRKELLIKCFDLFAHKGYASITMREIAKGLGVSTGTLYHYFPSKKELFWQLVEEQTRQDNQAIATALENAETLEERIAALFAFHAQHEDYFHKQILVGVNFYQQQDRKEVINNETLKQMFEESRQLMTELLGIQDRALINFSINLLMGLLLVRLFEGEVVPIEKQAELLGKMLTLYLKPQQQQEQT
ncbi:MAG TPA: TetR/AcrR family transcriptional regulator [Stenomitos sp.]